MNKEPRITAEANAQGQSRPQYIKPAVKELSEGEILSTFQVSVSAATWWVM